MPSTFQHRNLPHLLLIAREALLDQFRPILRARGLTEQQWRIIRVLSDGGPLPLKDIVTHCQIFGSSLTGIINRMEAQDFVARVQHPEDGRVTLISLTPKARRLVKQMQPLIDEAYRNIEAQLGEKRLDALIELLDETLNRFEARSEPGSESGSEPRFEPRLELRGEPVGSLRGEVRGEVRVEVRGEVIKQASED